MTPIPMIFHSAFCCSTLMASALDVPDHCLPLKEPQVLMSLANAKRILRQQNKPASQYNTRFAIVMKLLARKFRSTEQILLKPTNSVNNILEDTLSAGCPVTIMYASLEDFLISVLKKGEPCKSFIRTQFNIFTLDPCVLATIPHRQALTFTDLQIATLVWRHQMELFFKLKNAFPETLLLRDKKFLTNKLEALKSVSNVLNLNLSDKSLNAISVGSVFQRDSKFKDQELDGVQRAQDAKATKEKFSSELSHTLKWAENIRLEGDIFSY
ncbi:MAG: hypothetical protein HKO02_09975 [Hyphomonadaceae bacterium]|nr:hypothetical protein [Hyphomonadaceae bacterium]